jgi:hypothetical protein
MKLVLLAMLRRYWVLYLLCGLFLVAWFAGDDGYYQFGLLGPIMLAVLPLTFERQSGRLRYWLTLPVDPDALLRAYWTAAVIVPGVFAAAVMLLVLGVCGAFGAVEPGAWGDLGLVSTMVFPICGGYWYVAMRAGRAQEGKFWEQQLWGIAYGLSLGGCWFIALLLPRSWDQVSTGHAVLFAGLAFATVAGWGEREEAARPMRPQGRGRAGAVIGYPVATWATNRWRGYYANGLAVLTLMVGSWLLAMMLMGTVMGDAPDGGGREFLRSILPNQVVAITGLWVIAVVLAYGPLRHLRALRALPVDIRTLAGMLGGLPWVYGAVVSIEVWVLARLLGAETPLPRLLLFGATVVAAATMCLPAVLRWGLNVWVIGAFFGIGQMVVVLAFQFLPLEWVLPAAVAGSLLCTGLAYRQLDRSSHPYRGSIIHLAGWDRR